ncbi:LD-carboxypeptidase [Micromonospora polyrhachis]|uniref:Muramoyltetrapeptide carboxypeptidase n=1 Tax=Micromonospora polyrhachis TaxID=1282883 RepID=A0A7W7WRJ4_9ACTN|nr:LD-carboxypeptidase [Micromonospora polyrhachis]MBB4960994.1 muramoyltetrapeptide carboxypeptidase [Micromonospora polyrhachis]
MPTMIRPPAAPPGSTVAVVATSSPVSSDDLGRLVGYLHSRGYEVHTYPSCRAATGYLAGPAEQRAADLNAAFTDPDVRLIVPATGGKGAAQLLPLLDYDTIAANPTILTGMSDPSILLNAIHARTGLLALHGPSGYDFFQRPVHDDTATAFFDAITGSLAGREVPGEDWRIARGAGTTVRGPVVGGHLGTIRALVGTNYLPDLDGTILILEEVFVSWVDIDTALIHLRLAGVFDRIAALVVGVPVDTTQGDAPDQTWDDLILRCVGGTFPVITNVEFGHTPRKIPLPIGGVIELQLDDNSPVLRYRDDLIEAR